jgi:hypothetical protein
MVKGRGDEASAAPSPTSMISTNIDMTRNITYKFLFSPSIVSRQTARWRRNDRGLRHGP